MRLFFENKFFDFISEADYRALSPTGPEDDSCLVVHLSTLESPTPEKLVELSRGKRKVVIVAEKAHEALELFTSSMPVVRAAGGVVENDLGEILIMTRKGWRDLPKGHIEEGESAEEAAIREVCEETGLQEVEIITHLTTTRHFHNAYGRWEIKETEWFLMHSPGESPELSPEEGEMITAVEWMRSRRLWQAVEESYSTIKEVFEKFLEYSIR